MGWAEPIQGLPLAKAVVVLVFIKRTEDQNQLIFW